jgi:hypothetical protein
MKLSRLTLMMSAFLTIAGVARMEAAPEPTPPVSATVPGAAKTPITAREARAYAQREKAASPKLAKFAGGGLIHFILAGIGVVVIVIILIAVL